MFAAITSEAEKSADVWLIPIIAAVISSPFLFALLEYFRDKTLARFQYKGYQAVFLDNDQVYFGTITSVTKNELKLSDIYYLKSDEVSEGGNRKIDLNDVELIKLGGEIHGPSDEMAIARGHVLFIQSLKNDSKVVLSIRKYKMKGSS